MTGKDDVKELIKIVQRIVSRTEADGCVGCAYIKLEEWEQPCNKCRRAAKDYWRIAHE